MGSSPIEGAMTKEELASLVGRRVTLIEMLDDPDPILPGDTGEVITTYYSDNYYQLGISWDSGRTLSLLCPPDIYAIVEE